MDFQLDATADGRRLKFLKVTERDRRAQPPPSGDSGGQALQGQGRSGRDGRGDQPLSGADVHPV